MIRRRWIPESDRIEDLEAAVEHFFSDCCLAAAARKSTSYDTTTLPQRAWMARAYQMASALSVGPYSSSEALNRLPDLHALTVSEQEIRKVPAVLASMGIRFVVVEPLPRSKIDGAAMWMEGDRPIIAISARYDRIDGFWHTLCHELSHVLHGDAWSLDDDLVNSGRIGSDDRSEQEVRADREASSFLVPREKLDSFINRHRPRFSKANVVRFANMQGIHPGIVVGQLQHRKMIHYSHSREMLVPVRAVLTETAFTDGWGQFPSV
jgi:HTH-type transcriptional regulator/antitoxin HigA